MSVETARAAIEERIAELQEIHGTYVVYQKGRIKELDHHGAWDVAINLSETEMEISGLKFALNLLVAP